MVKWTTLTFKQLAAQKDLRMDAGYWIKQKEKNDKKNNNRAASIKRPARKASSTDLASEHGPVARDIVKFKIKTGGKIYKPQAAKLQASKATGREARLQQAASLTIMGYYVIDTYENSRS